MGLFDRFKSKNNFAQDFKDAYEKKDGHKMLNILESWESQPNSKEDANFILATVIRAGMAIKIKPTGDAVTTACRNYDLSVLMEPEDSNLYEWYKGTAKEMVMEVSTVYAIQFKEAYENKDYSRLGLILNTWVMAPLCEEDAKFWYASAISKGLNNSDDYDAINSSIKSGNSIKNRGSSNNLTDWYANTSRTFLK